MFLSDASVKKPVAMSCLLIGLTILGLNAVRKMGIELMPRMDTPYITITTIYPGANPEQIETDVAKRIEDVVVTIEGLKHVSSMAMENVCQTMLEFELDVDVDIAATDVREKLDLIRNDFPDDVEDPKILKYDINAEPIANIALTGTETITELYDYADNTLRDKLTVISGVADVTLVGGAKKQVQIILDRQLLAQKGLSSLNVVEAVRQKIKTIPSGRIQDGGIEYTVKFDADFKNIDDIGMLEVANENGQRCYVKDIGTVKMAADEIRKLAFIDGKEAVYIKVVKKSEANAVETVSSIKKAVEKLNKQLPAGMVIVWVSDKGTFIEATVNSAWTNVIQGILLTAVILFFFLYDLRTTFIVAITMPLTIIIGLFFMQIAGFTLNTSTLIAIGLSVGILVTNSIVVLEAVAKRLKKSGKPKQAAILAANEVFIAVLASAGTNIVVLFPIAIMGSMIGQFMKPLAWTMLIMTAVSLFISFTLTPMLCSFILRPAKNTDSGLLIKMETKFNALLDKITDSYRRLLLFNEKNRPAAIAVLVITILIFLHAMSLSKKIGFGFFSESDQGELLVKLEYPTRYDLDYTKQRTAAAEEKLKQLPELKHILTSVGKAEGVIGQVSEGVYLAQILLKFSERDQRNITLDKLHDMTREMFSDMPECIVTVTKASIIGGQSSDIELEIAGADLDKLDSLALKTEKLCSDIKGIKDTDTNVRTGKPEISIYPERAILSDLNIPETTLGLTVRANIEGIESGTFKKGDRNYDIVVKFDTQQGKNQIEQFMFPGAAGKPLLMTGLSKIKEKIAPIQITRKDKQRISKVLANLDAKMPLGTAVSNISSAIEEKGQFPQGYNYIFAGVYEIMAEANAEFAQAGLIAVILVILTLAAILESFKQPWLILATLPLALIGVMWALYLTGESLSMFVLLGLVMMVGIVVNNAILIIDQFNTHVREGIPRHKAMITASCERFRPILMITIAAVLGMMPLAVSRGIGAEIRTGVGIASIGGILISGVLTLIIIPILYDLFTGKGGKSEAPQPKRP